MHIVGTTGKYRGEKAKVISTTPIVFLVGEGTMQRPMMLDSWDGFEIPPTYMYVVVWSGVKPSQGVSTGSWKSTLTECYNHIQTGAHSWVPLAVVKARKDGSDMADHMLIPVAQIPGMIEAERRG